MVTNEEILRPKALILPSEAGGDWGAGKREQGLIVYNYPLSKLRYKTSTGSQEPDSS